MMRVFAAGMMALLLAPIALAQAPPGVKTFRGELSDKDKKDRVLNNSYHKVHEVELKAGKSYKIDLISSKFDAFLRLEDANKKQLASDDDGGDGLNSRIGFTPKKDGTYRIIVTSFAPKTGAYTLTVGKASGLSAAFLKIQAAHQAAGSKLIQEYKTAGEKRKAEIVTEFQGLGGKFGPKALALAEKNLKDPVAGSIVSWLFGRLRITDALQAEFETAYKNKAKNADMIFAKNSAILERIAKHFPKYKGQVDNALFLFKNLSVGKKAPQIEAEDIDGVKFKLTDYRGKVVVIDFWGDW